MRIAVDEAMERLAQRALFKECTRNRLGPGPGGEAAGDREPRRPRPNVGSGAIAREQATDT
jgi:hypothetical protein